ncbi:UDP-N-acetylmuramoyl-L-alanine--D-glutamate ligase [bacterium]|nr:UDP-N-acetylmuramoyl-L-alanine--D-glutamate ligase [bacterium]
MVNQAKKISILGLARSGIAAAKLAKKAGFKVFVSDAAVNEELIEKAKALNELGIDVEVGGHTPRVLQSDLLVVSPGVPLSIDVIKAAREMGIPVISEIEFAFRFEKGRVVAVTGSNGKSTTATLIARILEDSGEKVFLAGNIGKPYSDVVTSTSSDSITVLELSSFQLEAIYSFSAFVGILLNLAPDHLDRYDTVDDYYRAKFRLFETQKPGSYAVLNIDQPEVAKLEGKIVADVLPFTMCDGRVNGAWLSNSIIMRRDEPILSKDEIGIPGPHNLANALASVAATIPFEVPKESLAETLRRFSGIEHRLERFLLWNGILFVNDSKATNPESLRFALLSFDRPIVLIAGGYDKGADFSYLSGLVTKKVKAAVFTGATAKKMAQQIGGAAGFSTVVKDFQEAVETAINLAKKGDVVLLSPGCASFDAFKNFEHRGKVFKELVKKITGAKNEQAN